jgi:hypothetical protein
MTIASISHTGNRTLPTCFGNTDAAPTPCGLCVVGGSAGNRTLAPQIVACSSTKLHSQGQVCWHRYLRYTPSLGSDFALSSAQNTKMTADTVVVMAFV